MSFNIRAAAAALVVVLGMTAGCGGRLALRRAGPSDLASALTFHASFDHGTDADLALGDSWIYNAPGMDKWTDAKPGLPSDDAIQRVPDEGRYGAGLHFAARSEPVVFFRGGRNVQWAANNWGGTVSFWLRTDLEALPEGFCDPVQLTPRGWNDAAFFVEFERRPEWTAFRLGAYSDFRVWNPDNREWADIPPSERPLVSVMGPPFAADRWTHVAFTWARVNSGQADGRAVLYLNGAQVEEPIDRRLTFTWDPAESRLLLGVGFVGWIDDVAVFNRPLELEELRKIRALPNGIRSLGR